MSDAKIQLSTEELELAQNAGWLLTKNKVIEKAFHLFGEVAHRVRDVIIQVPVLLPAEITAAAPKISKGENYNGLPYVMLDYPRLFGKEDIFAVRVMFWWGHFISITLHIKGQYKQKYLPSIVNNLSLLQQHGFCIGISDDEWRHEFAEDNYASLAHYNRQAVEEMLAAVNFCKLSAKIPVQQWNQATGLLADLYEVIFTAIK
jgi:hypothetical protein